MTSNDNNNRRQPAKPLSLAALGADESSIGSEDFGLSAANDTSVTGPSPASDPLSVRSAVARGMPRRNTSPDGGLAASLHPQPSGRSVVSPGTTEATFSPIAPPSVGTQSVAAERIVELLRQKDEHIAAFRSEAEAFAEEVDLLKADKAAAVAQLHQLARRNEALTAQVEALQSELRIARDETRGVASDSRSAQSEINSLKHSLDHANRQLEHHRGEAVRLAVELNVERQQREAVDRLLGDRDAELQRLSGKLKVLQDETASLRSSGAAANTELRQHLAGLREQMEATKARLEQALRHEADAQSELERCEADRDTLRNELNSAIDNLREAQLQLRESQRQSDESKFASREASERADRLAEDSKMLLKELEELRGISASYQEEVYEQRRQLAAVRSELDMLREDNVQLTVELDTVTNDAAAMRKEMAGADAESAELHGSIRTLTGERDTLRQHLRTEQGLTRDLRAQCADLNAKKGELEEKVSELIEERAELSERVDESNRIIRRITADLEALQQRNRADLLAASETLRTQEDLFSRKEAEWAADEERFLTEAGHADRALRAAQAELAQLRSDAEELRAALTVAESRTAAEASNGRSFQSEVTRLRALAAESENSASQLRIARAEVSSLSTELDSLRKVHAATESQYRELIEAQKRHREDSRAKIDQLEKQVAALRLKLEAKTSETQRAIAADASLAHANQQCRRLSEQLEHAQADLKASKESLDSERATSSSLRRVIMERSNDLTQSKASLEQLASTLDATESALAAARRESKQKSAAIEGVARAIAADTLRVLDLISTKADSVLEPVLRKFDAFTTDILATIECVSRELAAETVDDERRPSTASRRSPGAVDDAVARRASDDEMHGVLRGRSEAELARVSSLSFDVLGFDALAIAKSSTGRSGNAVDTATMLADERRRCLEARRGLLRTFMGVVQRHSTLMARFAAARSLSELGMVCDGRPASDLASENAMRIAANDDVARVLRSHLRDGTQRSLIASQVVDLVQTVVALYAKSPDVRGGRARSKGDDARTPVSAAAPFGSTAPRVHRQHTEGGATDTSAVSLTRTPRAPLDDAALSATPAASCLLPIEQNAPVFSSHVDHCLEVFVFVPIRPAP